MSTEMMNASVNWRDRFFSVGQERQPTREKVDRSQTFSYPLCSSRLGPGEKLGIGEWKREWNLHIWHKYLTILFVYPNLNWKVVAGQFCCFFFFFSHSFVSFFLRLIRFYSKLPELELGRQCASSILLRTQSQLQWDWGEWKFNLITVGNEQVVGGWK